MFLRRSTFFIGALFLLSLSKEARSFDYTVKVATEAVYSPQVSFCIVDLKYRKNNLKVCELGEGAYSGFHGHERLFGPGKIWSNFWDFLASFRTPFYFVDPSNIFVRLRAQQQHNDQWSSATFAQHGGRVVRSFQHLDDTINKQKKQYKAQALGQSLLPDKTTLVMFHLPGMLFNQSNKDKITQLRYPDTVFVDAMTHPFVLNKLLTHKLFMQDQNLVSFRPQCLILPTGYTSDMVKKIQKTIKSDHYVVKPIADTHGNGIMMISKQELGQTLQKMFCRGYSYDRDPLIAYWQKSRAGSFLVESHESSDPIEVGDKHYDATMRVAFGIYYSEGTVGISFLGAYWKLPSLALEDTGPLTKKLKSRIAHGTKCSAKVAPAVYNEVKAILSAMLPPLFIKMIEDRHSKPR